MTSLRSRPRIRTVLLSTLGLTCVAAVSWGLSDPSRRERAVALLRPLLGEKHSPAESAVASPYLVRDDRVSFSQETLVAAGLRLETVRSTDEPVLLRITGRTGQNAEMVTHVHAQFPGRVAEVGVQLGSIVRGPGDPSGPQTVLCVVESTDLAAAKSDYLKAKVQLETDQDSLRRADSLGKSGVVSEKAQRDAQATVRKSQADQEAARQRLLLFGLSEQEMGGIETQQGRERTLYKVLAPRSGMVTEKSTSPGELADPSTNLFTIANTSTLWVWGDVYEHDLARLKIGQPMLVTVAGHEGLPIQSSVDWISPVIDPGTRSVRVRGTIRNAPVPNSDQSRLLADMYAMIAVVLDPGHGSVVLPATAVVNQGERAYVFVAGRGKIETSTVVAERRAVRAVPLDKDRVRVSEGLNPGEEVVVSGGLGLLTQMQQE